MLFRTRDRPDFAARVRTAVWPRTSWLRSAQYYKGRVVRLSGTPQAVALGFALGVGISFTPFLGFHVVIALAVAFLIGGNLVAAALGTAISGNPLTLPFIWASTYKLGQMLLGAPRVRGEDDISETLLVKSWDVIWPILKPMMVGSVPLGLLAGAAAYVIAYNAIRAYRALRTDRLAARRRERKAGTTGAPSIAPTEIA